MKVKTVAAGELEDESNDWEGGTEMMYTDFDDHVLDWRDCVEKKIVGDREMVLIAVTANTPFPVYKPDGTPLLISEASDEQLKLYMPQDYND